MTKTYKKTVILLDADIVAYKFASAAQKSFSFDDESSKVTTLDDFELVTYEMDEYIKELKDTLSASRIVICLSCPSSENFRYQVLPSYKSNRKDTVRPEYLQALKDYMAKKYDHYKRPTLEADDVMGILSTWGGFEFDSKKIIVSEDKDMKTIHGWLYNPRKDDAPWKVSTQEADYWHMYQTLVGDATDGYKGCPSVGPKKAEKLLNGELPELMWEKVVAIYELKGLTEEDALVQARVARICRNTDYDYNNRKVKLWTPQKYKP
jgi:DNA polymerase-1